MCTLSVDGFSLGPVPCVGSYAGPGSAIGLGTHTARLDVAAGLGGPTSCEDTFTVE